MLVVHHLGIFQSARIVWLCEELETPYRLNRHARDAVTKLAPAEYGLSDGEAPECAALAVTPDEPSPR